MHQHRSGRVVSAAACLLLALSACSPGEPAPAAAPAKRIWRDPKVDPAATLSPTAAPDATADLKRERAARPSDADGRGKAWLEGEAATAPVPVETPGLWSFVYECAAPGIAVGGTIRISMPYGVAWSAAQARNASLSGFVSASTDASGVSLGVAVVPGRPRTSVQVVIRGRALAPGERVRISYVSPADRSADVETFWFSTDGDGDGIAGLLESSPSIETVAAPPARLVAHWPTTARPGERVRLHVAAIDANGNRAALAGPISIAAVPAGFDGPTELAVAPDTDTASAELTVGGAGVESLVVHSADGLDATTNPLVVAADAPRVLWGDIHGHSNLSDGTGSPDDYFGYARDVAGIDVSALTDHDHFGVPRHLDMTPAVWARIQAAVAHFEEPGRFVTLLGFEWTSWLHGHRHVLYFGDEGSVLSSLDQRYETPTQLWAALRGLPALTFAHHPAGGPIATNWAFAPDPELEPLVEIVSAVGSSEAPDGPSVVPFSVAGNFVRDALDGGDRLGFVGSGDSHDGHPGCPDPETQKRCGLVAILAEDRTRDALLTALRARRTYATNGPRLLLDVRLDGAPMGSDAAPAVARTLTARIVAVRPLARIDLVRSGAVAESVPAEGRRDVRFERTLRELRAGEYVYLRALQIDGGAAWSSPFFIR